MRGLPRLIPHSYPPAHTILRPHGLLRCDERRGGGDAAAPRHEFASGHRLCPGHQGFGVYKVLVVNPSVPARSITELVLILKKQPDRFNLSASGFGTPSHLLGEVF